VFSLINFLFFGIEIAVACKIGPGLFFPHTHGTVIGAFTIGKNAVIYQGVTVGAKDLDFTYDAAHRPCIGDNVLLGAGAKVLGGIELGHSVTVAANAVLLSSVPDNVVVGGIPAKILKSRNG
jgi:serine O-acetyltransferase